MDLLVVLALERAPSGEAWAQALADSQAPVSFVQPFDTERDRGFVPMIVNGRRSGFYFLREPYGEVAGIYKPISAVRLKDPVVYRLSFGGHADECAAASVSASVLVSKFNGVAFDPQGGGLITAKQLRDAAGQCSPLSPP